MIDKLNLLSESEKEILYNLAILPNQFYSIPELAKIFYIEPVDLAVFFDRIHDLSSNGFLEINKANYRLALHISNKIISEIHPGMEECSRVVNYYADLLETTKPEQEEYFESIFSQIKVLLDKINKNSLHIAQLCYLLSSNLIRFNRYAEALIYNQLAVEISEKIDRSHPIVALFYRDKAYIHKKLGDSDKAIYYSLKDIEILEHNAGKYEDLLPDSYFTLSKTYEGIHNYKKAVEYNLKAIRYEKKRSPKKSINLSNLYHNLAYYYMKLNNLRYASMFINKAVESFSSGGTKNNDGYLKLVKDQKKFNALYEIELTIRKYKIPILVLISMLIIGIIWLLAIIMT